MNRFSINEVLDIVDNKNGKTYELSLQNRDEICNLLNNLCSDLDSEDLFLFYELQIYKDFIDKVLVILNKYDIKDLDKLDRVLFEQRLW